MEQLTVRLRGTMAKRVLPVIAALSGSLAAHATLAADPAFGEPTIYGRLNATVENSRIGHGETGTDLVDNGSRLGLRAGKDVADGRSVMIQLEARLRQKGEDGWWLKTRDNWVGAKDGSLGTLRLGKMEGPLYHATYDEISMHNHDSGHSADKLLAEDATGGRMTKSIYWRAPLQGSLKVELLHAFLEKKPDQPNADHPRHDEFAATYEFGDSWIAGGYAESRNLTVNKAWTLGAATNIKGLILAGLYERSAEIPAGGGATAYRNYARVALKYPVGQHEFHINCGVASSLSTTPDSGATQATLAYNYNLDNKSKLYAFITRISNRQNASYSFLHDTPDGAANRSLAIGYRRNF